MVKQGLKNHFKGHVRNRSGSLNKQINHFGDLKVSHMMNVRLARGKMDNEEMFHNLESPVQDNVLF